MKTKDPIKMQTTESTLTPSVAAFFASAQQCTQSSLTTSLALQSSPPVESNNKPTTPQKPLETKQKVKKSPKKEDKSTTKPIKQNSDNFSGPSGAGKIPIPKKPQQKEFKTNLSTTPTRQRVQSDLTGSETPNSSEKYAGSSFHKSPAAHTLPIPAFAKKLYSSSTLSPETSSEQPLSRSLPSTLMQDSQRLAQSKALFSMLNSPVSNPKKSESFNPFESPKYNNKGKEKEKDQRRKSKRNNSFLKEPSSCK